MLQGERFCEVTFASPLTQSPHTDGGATKASLDIIWSLRQLQQLSHHGGHAESAPFPDFVLMEEHIAVILSELHAAFARVLPAAGSITSPIRSLGSRKETFTSLSNLYIATLDLVARLLDDLPDPKKEADFEKVTRLVVLKVISSISRSSLLDAKGTSNRSAIWCSFFCIA